MDIAYKTNKEEYVSPESEVIEIDLRDWLLDYDGGNQETPEIPDGEIGW